MNLERLFAGERISPGEVEISTPRDIAALFVRSDNLLLPAIASIEAPANSDYFPFIDQNAHQSPSPAA